MPSSTLLSLAVRVRCPSSRLKLVELLDGLAGAGKHAEDVEADLSRVSIRVWNFGDVRDRKRTVLESGRHWPTVT